MLRSALTGIFKSTIDAETADLVSSSQIHGQEEEIDKLLHRLGEANRHLSDAIETDERKHTVTRAGAQVTQEMVISDFVRGPKGENRLETACML